MPGISVQRHKRILLLQVGDLVLFKLLKRQRRGIIAEEVKPEEMSRGQSPRLQPENHSSVQQKESSSKGSAWQAGTTESSLKEAEERVENPILTALGYNHFSKFTSIQDAPMLWKEAAEALAEYATEVNLTPPPPPSPPHKHTHHPYQSNSHPPTALIFPEQI